MRSKHETVLVIPDLQVPFHHKDSLEFLTALKEKYEPTRVVCIGDEVDFHALSDYDHDPDGFSAGHELTRAVKKLRPFYDLFPEVMSCVSNHTLRPFRKAYKYGIPKGLLKSYGEFLEAPTTWYWKNYWTIDEVRYEHGHELGGGQGKTVAANAPLKNGRSTVFGHFHSNASIAYLSTPEALLFGFNVGCLIDFSSYAFAYAHGSKSRPVLGAGIVDRGIPTFIPMLMNKKSRWVGELIG